ncbi:MAG: hypothetical protein KDB23_27930 [Planctomycetales bacterium]|nr:hypothetical protein [Planctomycetales bacterium]
MTRLRSGPLHCDDSRDANRRAAFSLLEVILVVGLTAVIVTMVASAIDFHLRQLTVRKTRIDEAQVARAILRQIADDLRSVVVDRSIDFSAVQMAAQNATGAAANLAADLSDPNATGATTGATDTSGASSSAASTTTTDDTSSATTTDSTVLPPGIYGSNYELQIDVSRVPRYEEYAVIDEYAESGMVRMLSDVKTISYYVVDATLAGGSPTVGELPADTDFGGRNQLTDSYGVNGSIGLPPDTPIAGLARRVNDRAEVRYATDTGDDSQMNQRGELIAPEVAYIEFSYFDGSEWTTEWDTQEMEGIPLAIEINLFLGTQDEFNSNRSSTVNDDAVVGANGLSYDPEHWYRMVVYLPISEALSSTADASSSTTDTTSSTTGASQ